MPLHENYAQKRALRIALDDDPAVRERAGLMLGGQIRRGCATKVRCPSCGRASVWWALRPETCGAAFCDHRGSCGWAGPIWKLIEERT